MQCVSDWMTLGPAIRKNGAAACSSRKRSEYWRPLAGSLCGASAYAGRHEDSSGVSSIHLKPWARRMWMHVRLNTHMVAQG